MMIMFLDSIHRIVTSGEYNDSIVYCGEDGMQELFFSVCQSAAIVV